MMVSNPEFSTPKRLSEITRGDMLLVHGAITVANTYLAHRMGVGAGKYLRYRLLAYALDPFVLGPLDAWMRQHRVEGRFIQAHVETAGSLLRMVLYRKAGMTFAQIVPLMTSALALSTGGVMLLTWFKREMAISEEGIDAEATGSDGAQQTATPAPDTMFVTLEMRRWAHTNAPLSARDLDGQTARFLEYHRAHGRRHTDWTAAWKVWMSVADSRMASNGNGGSK